MAKVSVHFNLNKKQGQLDFVDVELDRDNPLFVDPFAISQRPGSWFEECHDILQHYFQEVVDAIKAKNVTRARMLLSNLHEPKETRLGFSANDADGAGMGRGQAEEILSALRSSSAVKTGGIENLEESELMVDGLVATRFRTSPPTCSDDSSRSTRRSSASCTRSQCGKMSP